MFILPLELVNVDKLTISLSKYYKNNLPAFHLNSWEGREKLKEISSTEQKVDIPKNSEVNYPLNLAPGTGSLPARSISGKIRQRQRV